MLIKINDGSKDSENSFQINESLSIQTQIQMNQMVNDLNKTLIDANKQNNEVEKLNKTLKEMQQERST